MGTQSQRDIMKSTGLVGALIPLALALSPFQAPLQGLLTVMSDSSSPFTPKSQPSVPLADILGTHRSLTTFSSLTRLHASTSNLLSNLRQHQRPRAPELRHRGPAQETVGGARRRRERVRGRGREAEGRGQPQEVRGGAPGAGQPLGWETEDRERRGARQGSGGLVGREGRQEVCHAGRSRG